MLISVRKPATGITPFQCVLGFQPPLFPWSGEPSELPDVDSWLQRSKETWNDESPKSSLSNKGTSQSSSAHQSRLSAKSIFVSGYLARSPRYGSQFKIRPRGRPWHRLLFSRQEPVTVEGLCHKFSLYDSLQSPPEWTITRVLTAPFGLNFSYTPCLRLITCTGVSDCSAYLNWAALALFAKSCFAMQSFLSVFPMCSCLLITWTVNLFMMICCLLILTLPALPSYSIVCLPPASTLSTNSVYEYALPSLYLIPVTDLCLSDLSCDLIKLHIDPDATGSLHVFKKHSKVTLIQKGHINLIKR